MNDPDPDPVQLDHIKPNIGYAGHAEFPHIVSHMRF